MFDKLKKSINTASDSLKEQAVQLTDSMKESVIEKTMVLTDAVKEKTHELTDAVKEKTHELTDAVKEKTHELTDAVKEKTTELTDAVKEKTNQLFDDWLKIFPDLENYGLKVMSFGFCMGISPALDVELRGAAADFAPDRLEVILAEVGGNRALSTVFKAIKTTYNLHAKTGSNYHHFDVILIKLSIKITPEVMVYLGQPLLI